MDGSYSIVGMDDSRVHRLPPRELADRINRFCQRVISCFTEECFVERELFGEILIEHPDCWKLILDEQGEIRGFWHMIPLTESAFQTTLKGQFAGGRLERALVQDMVSRKWHDVYFRILCICPTIRQSLISVRFAGSIIDSLVDLARKGIFIDNVSMCLASEQSRDMNRFFLRFEYCCDHYLSGKMHWTRLPEFLESNVIQISKGRNIQELIRLYREATAERVEPACLANG